MTQSVEFVLNQRGITVYTVGVRRSLVTMAEDKARPITAELTREALLRDSSMRHSTSMENLLEHVFIGEVLQECWFRRLQRVEVMRAEVDAYGYDVVLECNGVLRHVQLKASAIDGKAAKQTLNVRLVGKASGCVVWIRYKEDQSEHRLKLSYLWFGGGPGEPLPPLGDKAGVHTRGGTAREGTREVKRSRFLPIATTGELVEVLFGPVKPSI